MPWDLCSLNSLRCGHIPQQGFKSVNCSVLEVFNLPPIHKNLPTGAKHYNKANSRTVAPLCSHNLGFFSVFPQIFFHSVFDILSGITFFQAPFWNDLWLSLWAWCLLLISKLKEPLDGIFFSVLNTFSPEWSLLWNGSETQIKSASDGWAVVTWVYLTKMNGRASRISCWIHL